MNVKACSFQTIFFLKKGCSFKGETLGVGIRLGSWRSQAERPVCNFETSEVGCGF